MILTITTTHAPATDLGYLLHKHPEKHQRFTLPFGAAHVFYPEATADRCTAALLLDVDPIGLVRGRQAFTLAQYVNDRPYVSSSLLSVALSKVFGTALNGRCKDRPALVQTPIPLEARLGAVPVRGGADLLRRFFEPLGYTVERTGEPLDPAFLAWGESPYHAVTLRGTVRLHDLLQHLYVLIPVLDNSKHYWIGEDEVEKLLARGKGWLEDHPEQRLITQRYLKRRGGLIRQALAQLAPETEDEDPTRQDAAEATLEAEKAPSLNTQRHTAVVEALKASGASRVLDLGCAEGTLLRRLLDEKQFTEIVGVDVSMQALTRAKARLRLDRLPARQQDRLRLLHGSLLYQDARLQGFDAAAVVEVIEHLDAPRLRAFTHAVFGAAQPQTVIVTTPNAEYNVLFPTLPAGKMRHADHRFEWDRPTFEQWATTCAEAHGYRVRFAPIGPVDATHGAPTQMAIFERKA